MSHVSPLLLLSLIVKYLAGLLSSMRLALKPYVAAQHNIMHYIPSGFRDDSSNRTIEWTLVSLSHIINLYACIFLCMSAYP
jgi:hypothetical protein